MHFHLELYLKKIDHRPIWDQVSGQMNRGVKSKTGWDWFMVGGRWSGCKVKARLDPEKLKAFSMEFEKRGYGWVSMEHTEEERRRDSNALFMEYFPDFKGEIPIYRDTYKDCGGEGDVCKVSELPAELSCHALVLPGRRYNEVLLTQEWDGKDFKPTTFSGDAVAELKKRGLTDGYLVTVDYHS